MSQLLKTVPVKFLTMVLISEKQELYEYLPKLEKTFGVVDYKSDPFSFDVTNYYDSEMGKDLNRFIISFERLIYPQELSSIKMKCFDMEIYHSNKGKRVVNIDPGYLDFHKVVLASFKYGAQKITLCDGVYADMVLMYENKKFNSLPWSFPDFKKGVYNKAFEGIRALYKKQIS